MEGRPGDGVRGSGGESAVPRRRNDGEVKTVALAIDRIEAGKEKGEEIAVLLTDDGRAIGVPRALLPASAREGDVLSATFRRDREATRKTAEKTKEVQDDLKATDPGGDIRL
jgi:hypothetical protein